jgi:phosphatidylethanolamine/phosphatidyl-N-methylethanolamine N-methyltransferase
VDATRAEPLDESAARREPTPVSHEVVDRYYREYYAQVHGRGTGGRANGRLQDDLERARRGAHFDTVLELGAGELGHVEHVTHSFRRYVAADLRMPPTLTGWTLLTAPDIPEADGRYFAQFDARELPFPDETFDRLVATCLLMHLDDPILALTDWRRVVKIGGVLDILVPCDPGLFVRVYRSLVSRRRAASLGFEHFDLVNALDHKSPVSSLLVIAQHVFENDDSDIDWYPFHVPSWNVNSHLVLRARRGAR